MAESSNDFGPVDSVGAEAVGQPGQRTFRLMARSRDMCASLWMEKEQLASLGTAIQQQIVHLGRPPSRERLPRLLAGSDMPPTSDVEMRCRQIGLGFDEAREDFVIFAYPVESAEDEPAGWSGRLSLVLGRALSREIEQIVNAGRPKCPLCGIVMDGPAHACPRSNGHVKDLTAD